MTLKQPGVSLDSIMQLLATDVSLVYPKTPFARSVIGKTSKGTYESIFQTQLVYEQSAYRAVTPEVLPQSLEQYVSSVSLIRPKP